MAKKKHTAYLLTGGNIEPRYDLIRQAAVMIDILAGSLYKCSSVYESEAWGFEADRKFLNQILCIETYLAPVELLECVLEIETKLGRIRNRNGQFESRRMDIDILYFDNEIIDTPRLVVPHPRLHMRRFTLMPLAEIAPDFVHPVLKKTNIELLAALDDHQEVMVLRRDEER
jgi:2-amino-4-hydroxy-6-hydroxymethyldihydropteridine diphosphokinase